jgi:hypothetical protein
MTMATSTSPSRPSRTRAPPTGLDPAVLGTTVDFLAELAGGDRALEFGIGTGRVALPVAACSMPFRYVWPAELDLMAALAGMRLRTLGATSKREQFESRSHVSVWQKPA